MRFLPFELGIFIVVTASIAMRAEAEGIAVKTTGTNRAIVCGWMGVKVRPMTRAFADSLGMVKPYGAIFERPKPGSPAAEAVPGSPVANAGIEAGDVITEINGTPLVRASDFAKIISKRAPGSVVYLRTWRDGHLVDVTVTLGSSKCPRAHHSNRSFP